MYLAVALFGLACGGTLAVAAMRECVVSVTLALGMAALWAAANTLWLCGKSDLIPFADLPLAVAAFAVWYDEGKPWQRAFAAIMAGRLGLHLFHPALGSPQEAAFFHVLNATFIAALVAISWEGGIKDAVGACGRVRGLVGLRLRMAALARVARATP